MAEFLNQKKRERMDLGPDSGLNAMGKPVPFYRMQSAYEQCKLMGLEQADAHDCVSMMAEQVKRDKPYEAMEAGMKFLDLTGTYRVMAFLCTAEDPDSDEGITNTGRGA